jgi:hypothetical protein
MKNQHVKKVNKLTVNPENQSIGNQKQILSSLS